ncbi:hypothetical protein FRX31_004495 [Thalictrum thalictroides]|uniref:Uncharacterized protein n=1 Tax=Thalictrum thalictroides TaxID=46969 RepID=A0A7J6XAF2_THATH|nr:hypothetical protein FRX31_004495 [Thalictrum thalictroides]
MIISLQVKSITTIHDIGRVTSNLLRLDVHMLDPEEDIIFILSRMDYFYKVDNIRVDKKCLRRDIIQMFEEVLGKTSTLEKSMKLQKNFVCYLLEKLPAIEYLYRIYRARTNIENGREELTECIPSFVQSVADLWFQAFNVKMDKTTMFRHYFKGDIRERIYI